MQKLYKGSLKQWSGSTVEISQGQFRYYPTYFPTICIKYASLKQNHMENKLAINTASARGSNTVDFKLLVKLTKLLPCCCCVGLGNSPRLTSSSTPGHFKTLPKTEIGTSEKHQVFVTFLAVGISHLKKFRYSETISLSNNN